MIVRIIAVKERSRCRHDSISLATALAKHCEFVCVECRRLDLNVQVSRSLLHSAHEKFGDFAAGGGVPLSEEPEGPIMPCSAKRWRTLSRTPRACRKPGTGKATVSLWSGHCFFAPGPRESTGTNSLRPQSIPVGPLATHPLNSGERAKCVQPLRPPFTEVARSTSRLLSAGTPASSH